MNASARVAARARATPRSSGAVTTDVPLVKPFSAARAPRYLPAAHAPCLPRRPRRVSAPRARPGRAATRRVSPTFARSGPPRAMGHDAVLPDDPSDLPDAPDVPEGGHGRGELGAAIMLEKLGGRRADQGERARPALEVDPEVQAVIEARVRHFPRPRLPRRGERRRRRRRPTLDRRWTATRTGCGWWTPSTARRIFATPALSVISIGVAHRGILQAAVACDPFAERFSSWTAART